MQDSPKHRPRSAYAQPGEIDTSLVETESPQRGTTAELSLNRQMPSRLSNASGSRTTTGGGIAGPERQNLGSVNTAESRPSPLRPNPPIDSFYKGLAPAGNIQPGPRGLAPAPGLVEAKPAALRLGIDPGLGHRNPALHKGLAPPPGIVPTPSLPLRRLDVRTPIVERKPAPTPLSRPELKPAGENPEAAKIPEHSPSENRRMRRGISARFELLPEAKPRWNRVGLSAGVQLTIFGLALLSPMMFPETMRTALTFDVVELAQPKIEVPVPPEAAKVRTPPQPPKPKLAPKVPKAPDLKLEVPELPPLVPQLAPQRPHVFLNLKPVVPNVAPKARSTDSPAPELKQDLKLPEIVVSSNGPKAPKEEAKPNPGAGNRAADTGNAAMSKVQTGTFGDPNGIAGPGNPNRRGNISQVGSPGLTGGPGSGTGGGGGRGLRGGVASDGSGSGAGAAAGGSASVTILYKPKPSYSVEGRERKLQGDVVLEVNFLASGQVKVIRVVSGLGFGMDDEAIRAAQRIRFTPALRDGKPIDVPARVRIEFRALD